jgi:hypothetical protein
MYLVFALPNILLAVPWLRLLVFALPNILLAVPWLRQLDVAPSQKPVSILKPMYVGFVAHEVAPADGVL